MSSHLNSTGKTKGKGKGKCVQQFTTSLTATETYVSYGITQRYLPPGRGDIPSFTLAN